MDKQKETVKYSANKSIKNNYTQREKALVEQLFMQQTLHPGTIGSMREDIWRELFEMVLPKKFVVEHSVFIIDSKGNVSKEVDLAILDEMYTPYIFRYERIKFIPIEAVAVVVECKSQNVSAQKTSIAEWSECMKALRTAGESITRTFHVISTEFPTTQKSTRPIQILCSLDKNVSKQIREQFDFVICALKKETRIKIDHHQKYKNLWDWFVELNFYDAELPKNNNSIKDGYKKLKSVTLDSYTIKDEDEKTNTLLTFNFQLNQLLMLVNNPLLFPHRAYVEMFNKTGE